MVCRALGYLKTNCRYETVLVRDSGFLDLIPGSMVSGDIAAGFWRGQDLPHVPDADIDGAGSSQVSD
jgi:hypothetical protein